MAPTFVVAILIAAGLARPADAAAQRHGGTSRLSTTQVLERRMAQAEALRRDRLARLKGPGITIAAAPGAESGEIERGSDATSAGVSTETRPRASIPEMVTEASGRYDLPPALVHAIIKLESGYRATARSRAGATGLMQVMPFWPGTLGHRFGSDLTDEETNLKYGTWVLQNVLKQTRGDLRRALLRYNGCTTAKCASYPDRVRKLFEAEAHASCGGAGWEACVVEPVRRVYEAAG